MRKQMPRRQFLVGGGKLLALPLLDAMIPSITSAAMIPQRFLAFYIPNGSYDRDLFSGRAHGLWEPSADYTFWPLALTPFQDVKQDCFFVKNLLNMVGLRGGTDESIDYPDAQKYLVLQNDGNGNMIVAPNLPTSHTRTCVSFLTSSPMVRVDGKFLVTNTANDSLDQIINAKLQGRDGFSGKTFVANLCARSFGEEHRDIGGDYFNTVSYKNRKAVAPMRTATEVMNSFFLNAGGTVSTTKPLLEKSVLDYMTESMNKLKREVGRSDWGILSNYLEQVRELEQLSQQIDKPGVEAPTGIPTGGPSPEENYATTYYIDYGRFLARAFALAAKADVVRSGVIMFGSEFNRIRFQRIITGTDRYRGVDLDVIWHGGAAHWAPNPEVHVSRLISIHRLQMKIARAFYDELKKIPEGTGTAIDNTLLYIGTAFSNGQNHTHDNKFRVFIGGKNLGIRRNGVLQANRAELSSLNLGILDLFGIRDITSFGAGRSRTSRVLSLRA